MVFNRQSENSVNSVIAAFTKIKDDNSLKAAKVKPIRMKIEKLPTTSTNTGALIHLYLGTGIFPRLFFASLYQIREVH